MNVFGSYARYYDLLYRDKDYAAEADYIHGLIRKHLPKGDTVLELGCGTGRHASLLAEKGYSVHGVDMSEAMITEAEKMRAGLPGDIGRRLSFSLGDMRTARTGRTFDVVISLFHVMSYQTTNEDLEAAFATARAHLKPGGLFIFDCWYGPAVLTDPPAVRVKRLSDEEFEVVRIAEPVMHPNENVVDVNYHVFIREKAGEKVDEIKETHRMRYLFKPELESFMARAGIKSVMSEEWMTGREPGLDTWGVCFGGIAIV